MASLATLAAARCAAEAAPTDSPEAVPAKIKEIHVQKVGALTGPEAPFATKPLDICGTDLGTMTEIGNLIFFAFGDTFGYDGDSCRGAGGPNWRSNAFASTTDHNPANGIALDWLRRSDGRAIAVVEGAHQPPFTGDDGEQTKIPTAMVSVGHRIYLHYMSVHGFSTAGGVWDCNYSKFVYSDDLGKTWEQSDFNLGERDSNFNMLALTSEQGRGNEERTFIYALGTPCGRFGSVKLARVEKENILNIAGWNYFSGDSRWTSDPRGATEIIPAPVGEGSILWNPGIQTLDVHVLKRADSLYRTTRGRLPLGAVERPAYGR